MSNPYAVIDDATGKVLRTGYCSNPDDIALQAGDGQTVDDAPPEGISADGLWTRAQDGTYAQADPPPPAPVDLKKYASQKANALIATAVSFTSGATTLESDCTSSTISNWMALQQWAAMEPTHTTKWVANNLTVTELPATAVPTIAVAVATRAGAIFGVLAAVLSAIEAEQITSTAQIDAVTWP